MKKTDRRPGRTCGKEWNVSATAKIGAKYTCPASKRSMEKLQEIMGDSKSAMLAAEFLRCDTERRLW